MNVKFHIEELGTIVKSEIELKHFLLFSGNSNLGKSYAALMIYSFYEIINNDAEWEKFQKYFWKEKLYNNISEFPTFIDFSFETFENYFESNVSRLIGYFTGNESFKCNVKISINQIVSFEIGVENEKECYFQCKTTENIEREALIDDYKFFITQNLRQVLQENNPRKNYLLPPARGGYLGFPASIFDKIPSGMYKEFISQLDELASPTKEKPETLNLLDKLLYDIFDGRILSEKGNLNYNFHGTTIPITAAASSIKELAPIFLLLKKYHPKQTLILWEEPENHLHPLLQRKIAVLVSYLINNGAKMIITTHSDYFFNQINNLIKLFHIRKKNNNSQFSKLLKKLKIDENLIQNPNKIGAYYFEKHNSKKSVIRKQELDYAIPIDAFKENVEKMMQETDFINDELYK